jgi:DNA polymerase III epsilon subunit-like protein
MAVHALPGLGSYTLDAVCAALGLSRSGEKHGALEDAILAGQVFAQLTKMRQEVAA